MDHQNPKKSTLKTILYIIPLIITFFLFLSGKFSNHPNPQYFIWSAFLLFNLLSLEAFLFIFLMSDNKKKSKYVVSYTRLFFVSLLVVFITSTSLKKDVQLPTFSDALKISNKPVFSLGTRGMSFSGIGKPIKIGEYEPFKPYIENGKLFVDVNIYSESGFPPIKIIKNELHNLPDNWDRNFNNKALEIVNEDKKPVYQLIYKAPFNINIKGVFPIPGGVLVADDIKGVSMISYNNFPVKIKLSPIFKYPSWRYPGKYKN